MPIGFQCEPTTGGCGITRKARWLGRCPGCGGLYHCKQTMVDADHGEDDGEEGEIVHAHGVRELGHVKAVSVERMSTGFAGLDRMLGVDEATGECGLAATAGHSLQLYSPPGCGKSTLLLQICRHVTRERNRVLYVAGEEGIEQVKSRSDRIGKFNSRMLITDDVDLDRLFYAIQDLQPDMVVVDSLQKIRVSEYTQGSQQAAIVAANDLQKLAGKRGMALLMILQMNKAGDDFSGAKAIEHAVDTSLHLRLERDGITRTLSIDSKNRYGRTPARQRFSMTDAGLVEIHEDPEKEQEVDAIEKQPERRGRRLRSQV